MVDDCVANAVSFLALVLYCPFIAATAEAPQRSKQHQQGSAAQGAPARSKAVIFFQDNKVSKAVICRTIF
jgi:hypothetical protein